MNIHTAEHSENFSIYAVLAVCRVIRSLVTAVTKPPAANSAETWAAPTNTAYIFQANVLRAWDTCVYIVTECDQSTAHLLDK